MIVLTNRCSLSYEFKNKFEKYGFSHYQDNKWYD